MVHSYYKCSCNILCLHCSCFLYIYIYIYFSVPPNRFSLTYPSHPPLQKCIKFKYCWTFSDLKFLPWCKWDLWFAGMSCRADS